MRVLFFAVLVFSAVSFSSASGAMEYYLDPVYEKMAPEDGHPMDDMIVLAKNGDLRAKFILGDLYYKGKGGLPKDIKKSREYFEDAAMHGYAYSLIRLAAMEKKFKKHLDAWKWYTIAIRYYDYGDMRTYVLKSRGELTEKYKITEEEIKKTSKAVKEWEDRRDKLLADEHKAEVEKKKQAALKAKEDAKKAKATPSKPSAVKAEAVKPAAAIVADKKD